MNQIEIIKKQDIYGGIKYICKIPTKKKDVFMLLRKDFMDKENREYDPSTVFVDSDKFLKLWRNEPDSLHKKISHGNENSWRKDSKFHWAEEGFNDGIENPVPLATVSCENNEKNNFLNRIFRKVKAPKIVPSCSINDGITRTIWLLSNGAKYFPVEIETSSSELLKFHTGAQYKTKITSMVDKP
jgi:hypothetical protein